MHEGEVIVLAISIKMIWMTDYRYHLKPIKFRKEIVEITPIHNIL